MITEFWSGNRTYYICIFNSALSSGLQLPTKWLHFLVFFKLNLYYTDTTFFTKVLFLQCFLTSENGDSSHLAA